MGAPLLEQQLQGGEIHPIRERFFCGVKIFVDLRGRVRPRLSQPVPLLPRNLAAKAMAASAALWHIWSASI